MALIFITGVVGPTTPGKPQASPVAHRGGPECKATSLEWGMLPSDHLSSSKSSFSARWRLAGLLWMAGTASHPG